MFITITMASNLPHVADITAMYRSCRAHSSEIASMIFNSINVYKKLLFFVILNELPFNTIYVQE